jgi:hypothetical protein
MNPFSLSVNLGEKESQSACCQKNGRYFENRRKSFAKVGNIATANVNAFKGARGRKPSPNTRKVIAINSSQKLVPQKRSPHDRTLEKIHLRRHEIVNQRQSRHFDEWCIHTCQGICLHHEGREPLQLQIILLNSLEEGGRKSSS